MNQRVPLAEEMRPKKLADVIGQQHLLGPDGLLSEIVKNQQPVSLIFWGPPGSGKTTLARIVANEFGADFVELSAVTAGKADVNKVVERARRNWNLQQRTILFVGELHLSVLIETLRREGYEFEVGRPQVVTIQKDGQTLEPVEELLVEVGDEFVGVISQELGVRRAELKKQEQTSSGATRMTYRIPTRGLIGLRNLLLTATKGTVIMHSLPDGYEPLGAKLNKTRNGALIATEAGTTTPYALQASEARGTLFIGPGVTVYQGMIVGQYNRQDDLDINVCRAKQLTNMRSSSSDGTVQLTPFTKLSLEQSLDFIEDDELLEVTPKSLRLRKRYLDPNARKRHAKN